MRTTSRESPVLSSASSGCERRLLPVLALLSFDEAAVQGFNVACLVPMKDEKGSRLHERATMRERNGERRVGDTVG